MSRHTETFGAVSDRRYFGRERPSLCGTAANFRNFSETKSETSQG